MCELMCRNLELAHTVNHTDQPPMVAVFAVDFCNQTVATDGSTQTLATAASTDKNKTGGGIDRMDAIGYRAASYGTYIGGGIGDTRLRPCDEHRQRHAVYSRGLSLDGGFGFPTLDECCECQVVGTAPGRYRAVVIEWR